MQLERPTVILLAALAAGFSNNPPAAYAGTSESTLACVIGRSPKWGSSWCDLQKLRSFREGTNITIQLQLEYPRVLLVRFLSANNDPDEPLGIVDGPLHVSKDGIVTIILTKDYIDVKQISVHGGPHPWDFDLEPDNKAALLESIHVSP